MTSTDSSDVKVFISYKWGAESHQQWVLDLATRLRHDRVDVVLDRWDLSHGYDTFVFMESMVTSETISKVLIVSDKGYAESADQRIGGVGTESQIISPEVYKEAKQEKFIPILRQRKKDGSPYLPTFLKSRMYIDFTKDHKFEESYDQLLRNIHGKPELKRPKLGKIPSYLDEEVSGSFRSSSILRRFQDLLDKHPRRSNVYIQEFLDSVYAEMDELAINFQGSRDQMEIGQKIVSTINQYSPIRDNYISFLETLFNSQEDFDSDIFLEFISKLGMLQRDRDDGTGRYPYTVMHFKFIAYELFLYSIAAAIKTRRYGMVELFVQGEYEFMTRPGYDLDERRFDVLYVKEEIIDKYYQSNSSINLVNPQADLIIKRIPNGYTKGDIVQVDYLLYYVGQIDQLRWFPQWSVQV